MPIKAQHPLYTIDDIKKLKVKNEVRKKNNENWRTNFPEFIERYDETKRLIELELNEKIEKAIKEDKENIIYSFGESYLIQFVKYIPDKHLVKILSHEIIDELVESLIKNGFIASVNFSIEGNREYLYVEWSDAHVDE